MNVSEMLSVLGDYGFTDTGTPRKVEKLQAAIWEVEGHKPWPFLEASADLNFDGSSGLATNFPTNFRALLKLRDLSTGNPIPHVRLDDFEEHVGTRHDEVGDPVLFYVEGGQVKVWPVPPTGDARIRMKYVRWSDPITDATTESGILIPKRFHEVIVYGALLRLYDMEDDPELSARIQGHYEQKLLRMELELLQNQFDRPDVIHVIDPDDYDHYL